MEKKPFLVKVLIHQKNSSKICAIESIQCIAQQWTRTIISFDYVEDCISNVWVYIEFIFEKIGDKNKLEINYKEVFDLDSSFPFLFGMGPRSFKWQNFEKEME